MGEKEDFYRQEQAKPTKRLIDVKADDTIPIYTPHQEALFMGKKGREKDSLEEIFAEVTKSYKNLFNKFLDEKDPDFIPHFIPPKKRRHRKLRLRSRPCNKKK